MLGVVQPDVTFRLLDFLSYGEAKVGRANRRQTQKERCANKESHELITFLLWEQSLEFRQSTEGFQVVVFAQVGEVVPADGEGFFQGVEGQLEELLLLGLFGVGGGGFVFGDEFGTARVKAGGVVTVVLVLRCPLAQLISLLKNLPTGLAPVESGLCTTPFQLDSKVVQRPASHRGKPGGDFQQAVIGGWDGVGEFASFEHFDGSKHFFTGRDGSPFRLE